MSDEQETPLEDPSEGRQRRRIVGAWIVIALLGAVALLVLVLMQRSCDAEPLGEPPATSAVPSASLPPAEPPSDTTDDLIFPEGAANDDELGEFNTSAGTNRVQVDPNETGTVPDVMGLSRSAARAKVEAAGFRYFEIERPAPATYQKIWDQEPDGGDTAEIGSDVYCLYGIGE